jgi:tRNA A22 N-methylase
MITQSQQDISQVCNDIRELLLEKNRKYGDAALNPLRIFSKANTLEQIKVRLDDKLSRLKNAQDDEDEDVIADLTGYLILYMVARMQERRVEQFIIT